MPQHEEIVWNVLTHEHKEHSNDWYWALGLAIFVGVVLSVVIGNILLAIILLIGGVSIAVLKIRGPREHQVKIDARGITLDGTLYPWRSIQSFWVREDEIRGDTRLYIVTHSFLMPRITLALDDAQHAERVRLVCLNYTQEKEQTPHIIEHLADIVGL